jgi:DDE domain
MRDGLLHVLGGRGLAGWCGQYLHKKRALIGYDSATRGRYARYAPRRSWPPPGHEQYNPIESDHGRLKARLRPMRGLKRLRSARAISIGHAAPY